MLRSFLLPCLFLLAFASISAQVVDDFTDGDFSNNPTWAGDATEWEVLNGELHLNNAAPASANNSHLSTPSAVLNNGTWEFYIRLDFSPSASNYVDFFLASDNADLETAPSGYFVRVGGTTDEISLFRSDAGAATELVDGLDGTMNVAPYEARIRVTRDAAGLWTLWSDTSATGTNFVQEGTATDLTYGSSAFCGPMTRYTSTRNTWCYLDDINIFAVVVPDTTAPLLLSVSLQSSTQVRVAFSEVVDPVSALDPSNYLLNNLVNPGSVQYVGTDSSRVELTFGNAFGECVTSSLEVTQVQDTAGNVMADSSQDFVYANVQTAVYRDVIVNEIHARESATGGLPNAEFVELYNRGTVTVNLANWTFFDNSATPYPFPADSFALCPGEYVILCEDTSLWNPFGKALEMNLPTLNTTGTERVLVRNAGGVTIDSLVYAGTWLGPAGVSLELINPEDECAPWASNWVPSTAALGGTPGQQNSVYNTTINDVTGPLIQSVTASGGNSILVCFDEEVDAGVAGQVAAWSTDNGLGNPVSAAVQATNATCVELIYPGGSFSTGVLYTVTAAGMSDCYGNVTNSQSGQFLIPGPAAWRAVIVNEIFSHPNTNVSPLLPGDFIELYNRGNDIVDLNGWTLSDAVGSQGLDSYVLFPGDYLILCDVSDTQAYAGFGAVLGVSGLPGFNSDNDKVFLEDAFGNAVDSVAYDDDLFSNSTQAAGGWSLELINPNDTCSLIGNWDGSQDPDGATPGAINSIFNASGGVSPTAISGFTILSNTSLELCFNETMDPGLLGDAQAYQVDNGIGSPLTAVPSGSGGECVVLTFANAFASSTLYTLSTTNLADCNGNPAPGLSQSFLLPGPSSFRAVVINEIFSEQDLAQSPLLVGDYAELYNRGTQTVDLGGWTFRDRSSTRVLNNFILSPGEYLILCDETDTAAYAAFGNVLGVASFPGLNNDDDELWLADAFGNIIDSVYYDDDLFQDPNKENGGWSLELINPQDTCSLLGNWIGSNDPDGGTPGAQNSVYDLTYGVDTTLISSIRVLSTNSVEACFNETMDAGLLANTGNYSIDNGLGVLSATPGGVGGNCVVLVVNAAIDTGTVYTLTVNGVADCQGNPSGTLTGTFVQGGLAAPFQVVINEIMADPSPVVGLPEDVEFVELYNNGPTTVSLTGWTLDDPSSTNAVLPDYNLLPGEYVIVCDDSDAGDLAPFGTVLATSVFPSLGNTGDSLRLIDQFGNRIDVVNYDRSWYQDEVKEDGGWTLERIDPAYSCPNGGNWRASADPAGGTPGQSNSIQGTFADNTAPRLVRASVLNPNVIRLQFNEQMDPADLYDVGNYVISEGIGNPLSVMPVGDDLSQVELLLIAGLDSNLVYCVQVSGVRDCPGNLVGLDDEVCFGIPLSIEPGDLVINEILFNPYSGGSDFVELYNVSDKIVDLSTLYIGEIFEGTDSIFNADQVSAGQLLMLPQTYICLTADKAVQVATYAPIDPDAIFEMGGFPSYDDSDGECVIYVDSATVIDRLAYLDDWHFPNLDSDDGVSLERHDFFRPTQDEDNWHSAASTVLYATPGYENSQILNSGDAAEEVWLDPVTFSPDLDGTDDVLGIHYAFNTPGWNLRVNILDNKGRPVRELQQNLLVGTEEGTLTWDGTNDLGQKMDVGIYVVLAEATQPSTGEVRRFKLGCVLAALLGQ